MWNGLVGDYSFWESLYIEEHGANFNPFNNSKDHGIMKNTVKSKYMMYGNYGLYTFRPKAYYSF